MFVKMWLNMQCDFYEINEYCVCCIMEMLGLGFNTRGD